MATRRRPPITAAELQAQLLADPEFVARKQERDRVLAERVAQLHAEQTPIVVELRKAGLDIEFLWNLLKISTPYKKAIPILLRHLLLPYSDATQETIARALAVPDAKDAWPTLVAEYRKAPVGYENGIKLGAKDGLAVALAATVTDAVVEELIALAKDQSHGSSRLLLLRGLKKSKRAAAKRALKELAFDPALAKEIASWKKTKKSRATAIH